LKTIGGGIKKIEKKLFSKAKVHQQLCWVL